MTDVAQLHDGLTTAGIEAILRGQYHDPFSILGPHDGQLRVFAPQAAEVSALTNGKFFPLEKIHPEGFFCGPGPEGPYELAMRAGDHEWQVDDPYRFGPVLGEMDEYLLAEGSHRRLYDKLGAHPMTHQGVPGVAFAVWAPNARRVSVVGHFNAWDGRRHPMRRRLGPGIWELFIPGLTTGEIYKYEILSCEGDILLKADPFAFAAEEPPRTASITCSLADFAWGDDEWMAARAERDWTAEPLAIYEVHPGSWRRSVIATWHTNWSRTFWNWALPTSS